MKTSRNIIQLSILHLVGVVTVAALWSAYFHYKGETLRMQEELIRFQDFNPVLIIQDADQVAILEEPFLFQYERTWQVYIPDYGQYELLASESPRTPSDLGEPESLAVPLSSGQHRITLRSVFPTTRTIGEPAFHRLVLNVGDRDFEFAKRPVEEIQKQNYGMLSPSILKTPGATVTHPASTELMLMKPSSERDLQWQLELRPVTE